jgi:ribosomal protein S18 acetylase RimI-like enzyme
MSEQSGTRQDRTAAAREIVITSATSRERDWCAELMAQSEPWITLGRTIEVCRPVCHHPEYQLFVAHFEDQPCGFILIHPRGVAGSPYITSIAVSDLSRGLGIGTRLLAFAEEHFRPQARHLFLCVSSFNSRARALYERLGYEYIGELKDYVIIGASEMLMHKWLGRP